MSKLTEEQWGKKNNIYYFSKLLEHNGHNIGLTGYGKDEDNIENMSVECLDCNEVLMDFEESYEKPMDELCEIAHKKLKAKCKKLNIIMDKRDENGDLHYTEKAQDIFNKILDDLDYKFNK